MPITIGANIASLKTQRQIGQTTDQLARVYERLSSGQRINRASDDAAGLAIAMSLNANSRILGQALRNISDTISLTSVSEGAMHALEQVSVRQKELAEQSANGVYSSKQRTAMDAEARALTNEYNRIILTTKFNGQALLSSSWEELRTQAGVGTENSLAFKFADDLATKVTPGSYFTINSPDQAYYVWYTLDGVGTDPHAEGTGLRVDLHTNSQSGTTDTPGTTALLQTSNPDANSYSDGDFFYISSATNVFYVWFNLDGSYSDPGDQDSLGATQVEVDITSGQTQSQVTDAIITALTNTGQFTGVNYGNGDGEITTTTAGSILFSAYNYQGPTTTSQQTSGTDLIPGTAVNQTITGDQVRDAVATTLVATGKFTTLVASDGSLKVTNTVGGRAPDIADFNSGNLITDKLTQGTGLSFLSAGSSSDGGAREVRTADLNGDGAPDIISADSILNTMGIRLGDGEGGFGAITTYTTGNNPSDFGIADFNGDGKLDVVNVNQSAGSITVRMGVGNGTFGVMSTYSISAAPYKLALGDLNGDGRIDLVTGSSGNEVCVLLNQGNGTFGAATTMTGLGDYVQLGDINHDGKLDLAVTSYGGNKLFTKFGNGDGTFGASTSYALGGSGSNQAVLRDLNGDGWLDFATPIVFAASTTVLLNNQSGGFGSASLYSSDSSPSSLSFADMNEDGKLDMITGDYATNNVSIRLGNGNGTFGSRNAYSIGATSGSNNGIYSLTTSDLDGDGHVDVLAGDYGRSRVALLFGNGSGGFEGTRSEVTRLIFGDARGMTLINQIDLTTRRGALRALDILDARLDRIHRQVGTVGAVTSRLDSALKVTSSRRENFLAAESRIKDADIANETAALTKSQIIQQVAGSVLAQANQIPALALTLLR